MVLLIKWSHLVHLGAMWDLQPVAIRCSRIIMAAMLLTVNFMRFLVISLRHEAEVIHSTCYGLLQKQEATKGWALFPSQLVILNLGPAHDLVGGLEHVFFLHVLGIVILTD
jgi:hypothetical protein